jgi:hypothetical protein
VEERGDIASLRVRQVERRHARRPSAPDDRRDHLAVLIVLDHLRSQQARPAIAAAGVRAVAERAAHAVEAFAALDRRGIGGWSRWIDFGPPRRRRGSASAAAGRLLRLAFGRLCAGRHVDGEGDAEADGVDVPQWFPQNNSD